LQIFYNEPSKTNTRSKPRSKPRYNQRVKIHKMYEDEDQNDQDDQDSQTETPKKELPPEIIKIQETFLQPFKYYSVIQKINSNFEKKLSSYLLLTQENTKSGLIQKCFEIFADEVEKSSLPTYLKISYLSNHLITLARKGMIIESNVVIEVLDELEVDKNVTNMIVSQVKNMILSSFLK